VSNVVTAQAILKEIEPLGSDGYKRILCNHGAREPLYGVKISELKKIQKRIKKDYQLALDLYDTGNYDAMYLAGLIADDAKMTKKDLQRWVDRAYCSAIGGCTVAWVTAEGEHGWEMALKWIDSKKDTVASAGWATLGCLVALIDDNALDMAQLKKLLQRVATTIHQQPNDVRSVMNHFVISLGSYVKPLTSDALAAAKVIGEVYVDMGDTACKVPDAAAYIKKVKAKGALGKKRGTVKC
jgi:putative intracellular protease/amidase